MSFKQNDINLSNYEEYFILYMDGELSIEQKMLVENFISLHPQLAEELNALMSTKLPLDDVSFSGKEELLSANMKMNLVDENLLLYIDDELNASEKGRVEERLKTDRDFNSQYSVLLQTRLDASEKILHPNKKELYRHTERVVVFKIWMRVAAAVILVLSASVFFLINRNENTTADPVVAQSPPKKINNSPQEKSTPIEQLMKQQAPVQQEPAIVKAPVKRISNSLTKDAVRGNKDVDQNVPSSNDVALLPDARKQREVIKFDVNRAAIESQINELAFNNPIAYQSVTSSLADRKTDEDTQEPAVTDGDFKEKKKTPAKGFFRKVSRFIERNTGIGTVNADNELLIGAVALKLK